MDLLCKAEETQKTIWGRGGKIWRNYKNLKIPANHFGDEGRKSGKGIREGGTSRRERGRGDT